jgi:myo-inositol-1(or 4)-monophosphatase
MDIYSVFRKIVDYTASLLRELYGREDYIEVTGYGVSGDVSRRIDIIAEDYIVDALKSNGLNALVVGEEKGARSIGSNIDYIVLVDPLDGSLNYSIGIPFASVSLAVYKPGSLITQPIYGVVRSVFTNEIYELCNNNIYYNGRVLTRKQSESDLVLSIYTENPQHLQALLEVSRGIGRGLKIRTMGSASLEAIYASIGSISAFIHLTGKLRNSDVAVAMAIAEVSKAGLFTIPRIEEISINRIERIEKIIISQNNNLFKALVEKL